MGYFMAAVVKIPVEPVEAGKMRVPPEVEVPSDSPPPRTGDPSLVACSRTSFSVVVLGNGGLARTKRRGYCVAENGKEKEGEAFKPADSEMVVVVSSMESLPKSVVNDSEVVVVEVEVVAAAGVLAPFRQPNPQPPSEVHFARLVSGGMGRWRVFRARSSDSTRDKCAAATTVGLTSDEVPVAVGSTFVARGSR